MRRLRLVLAVAVLAAACSAQPPSSPKEEHPLIGILRDDGTLLPFARYVDGAWQPPVVEAGTSPASLAELGTRPAAWFASHRGAIFSPWYGQLRDGPRVTLRARQIVSTDNHCEKNWGLSTDFPARPAERRGAVGVATTAPYRWDSFEDWPTLAANAAEHEAIRMFDAEEENALVARALQGTAPGLPPTGTRAGTFVSKDVVRRSSQAMRGVYWSYVEATRKYPRPDAPQCPLISLFRAWVANGPSGVRTREHSMDLTDCDRKGTISSMPLGLVTVDDKSFAVTVDRGYEDDGYSIIQLAPEFRRVLHVTGGGC